jgi:hypothetical protein
MLTLDWIGKKAVLNHHNEVPFHPLREEPSLSVGDPGSGALMWKSGCDFTTTIKWSGDFFLGSVILDLGSPILPFNRKSANLCSEITTFPSFQRMKRRLDVSC